MCERVDNKATKRLDLLRRNFHSAFLRETLVEFVSRPNRFARDKEAAAQDMEEAVAGDKEAVDRDKVAVARDKEAVARDNEAAARDKKLLEDNGSIVENTESSLSRDLLQDMMKAAHYLP